MDQGAVVRRKEPDQAAFRFGQGGSETRYAAQYIEMMGTGHNALDFHIAFYIGRISVTDKDAYFHIVSNDQGFDPLIAHLKQEHIFAARVTEISSIPAILQTNVISKTSAERIAFAKERLQRPNASRPRARKKLTTHVAAMFMKALSEADLAQVVEGRFRTGKTRWFSDHLLLGF